MRRGWQTRRDFVGDLQAVPRTPGPERQGQVGKYQMAARVLLYGRLIHANGARCRVTAGDMQVPGIGVSLPVAFSKAKFGGLASIDVLHRASEPANTVP